jgi:hypothetical protein
LLFQSSLHSQSNHRKIKPLLAHGFTSGNNGRLGIPEWNLLRRVKFNEGDEIWEVSNDGKEILRAIYSKEDKKFIIIK